MASLVRFQALLAVETTLTGGALERRVCAPLMTFESGVSATGEVAFGAGEGVLVLMDAFGMVPKSHAGAEAGFAVRAGVPELPGVASEVVAPHIVQGVAAEVAERAEVSRLPVVDTRLVLPQFGHGAEGLAALLAGVAPDTGVQGPVLLQTVATGRAEGTVRAAVGSRPFVFDGDVLGHASRLFTGEVAVLAVQALRLGFLVDGGNVTRQRVLGLCHERAEVALDLVGFHAAPPLVAFQSTFLTALKRTLGTGDELFFRFFRSDCSSIVRLITEDFF